MKKAVLAPVLCFIMCSLFCSPASCQEQKEYNARIAWDYSSMRQIAEAGGYPRITRLKDSTILVIYETRRGSIHLKSSRDDGITWSAPTEVFSQFVYTSLEGKQTLVNTANPEIKQLNSGDIVIACNYRPSAAEIAPYSIVIRRSTDNARTWLPPQSLYSAAPRFSDGCWEPSFLQLPDGELQVYFAYENPYRNSDEQEISMLYSNDNGASWAEEIKTISFRKGRRDGMPVPALVGEEIVVAIEDNKVGQFKPYTVRTRIKENWHGPVSGVSEDRNYALEKPVKDTIYMGAPHLLRLQNGQTLLSYQSNENREHNWEHSTMEVAVGDIEAKNFKRRTRPFNVPLTKEAKWNTIAIWDKHTIAALSSSNFKSAHVAPWMIKGYVISDIDLGRSAENEQLLFIGARGEANLRARVERKADTFQLSCTVSDREVRSDLSGISLFFHSRKNTYKLCLFPDGTVTLLLRKGDKWEKSALPKRLMVRTVRSGEGYKIDCRIPLQFVSERSNPAFSFGMALSATKQGEPYTEYLANMGENDRGTWINVFKGELTTF